MLTLYFDFTSAASVVAVLRLQRLADEGLPVAFEGFDPLGLDTALPFTLDQYAEFERYADRAAELGMPLRRPALRPATVLAHVVGGVALDQGLGASWRQACLRAYWRDGLDLGEPAQLARLADDAGLDVAAVTAALEDRGARQRLRQRMVALRGRGIGGVPVLEVAGGTMISPDLPDADLRALAGT
ncbi:DsbA family protein [Egicoccus sp. AB-alg6-2]|uniref:DsbA family oxidoreductase n=1 Tax=Egicoccus sp. AB-alg6-2 TaxID=3242692 RepID=UPI00359CC74B